MLVLVPYKYDYRRTTQKARTIWGDEKLSLEEIIIRLGVGIGDIHRIARDAAETGATDEAELQKELGNILVSVSRWCDDLGYDPNTCIEKGLEAQRQYRKKQLERREA